MKAITMFLVLLTLTASLLVGCETTDGSSAPTPSNEQPEATEGPETPEPSADSPLQPPAFPEE